MIKRTILFLTFIFITSACFAERPLVVVVKGENVDAVVKKAVDMLGGMALKVKKGDRIAIKVSLDDAKPSGSNEVTNVEVVRAIARMCKEAGARRVVVMDGSLRSNTYKAFDVAGYTKMAREEGIVLKDLDSDIVWRAWLQKGVDDSEYKKYPVATTILNGEVFINVPVMRADDPIQPGLALKNMLGVIDDKRFKRYLPKGADLDELIIDMNLIKQSDLVIMDGTAMGGVVIAGYDPVSVDTVACKLLKLDTTKINYLKMAAEKGLGENDISNIEIKSEDI